MCGIRSLIGSRQKAIYVAAIFDHTDSAFYSGNRFRPGDGFDTERYRRCIVVIVFKAGQNEEIQPAGS